MAILQWPLVSIHVTVRWSHKFIHINSYKSVTGFV